MIFCILFALTIGLYAPSYGSGFVTDFLGWQERASDARLFRFLNSFGFSANYQFTSLILFILYKLFWIHALPWFLVFTGIHALNGSLLFRILKGTLSDFQIRNTVAIAGGGTLLFLCNPYMAEAVIWKAGLHHLLSGCLLLGGILLIQKNQNEILRRDLILFYSLFVLALFTLGYAYVTPLILLAFIFFGIRQPGSRKKTMAAKFILPLFGFILLYMALNKITLGTWIGHYARTTEISFDFLGIFSSEFQYLTKHLFFLRFFPYEVQHGIYSAIASSIFGFFILTFTLTTGILLWHFRDRMSSAFRLSILFVVLSAIALLPFTSIYFYYLQFSEGDRYSYISCMFLFPAILLFIQSIARRNVILITLIYLGVSTILTLQMNLVWRHGTQIYHSLIADFRWNEADEIYVLNIPDNYCGTYMFRNINHDSALEEVIRLQKRTPINGKVYDILKYNMVTHKDGVSVSRISENTLKVQFNQWGNWWWRNGIGATSYSNQKYAVSVEGQHYNVTFHDVAENAVFIYQDGESWKEFKWNGNPPD